MKKKQGIELRVSSNDSDDTVALKLPERPRETAKLKDGEPAFPDDYVLGGYAGI